MINIAVLESHLARAIAEDGLHPDEIAMTRQIIAELKAGRGLRTLCRELHVEYLTPVQQYDAVTG